MPGSTSLEFYTLPALAVALQADPQGLASHVTDLIDGGPATEHPAGLA